MRAANDVRVIDQRTATERDRPFLPGAGRPWLLPFYDLFTRVADVPALHERTVQTAGIGPGDTVLDVGCGTGNLSLAVLAAQPGAVVSGLDPDAAALRRAARKARRRAVPLTLVQGYADRLPPGDASLDHVVSALALHHVDDESRLAFARDAFRALRPGGTITIADFGDPVPASGPAGHTEHGHGERGSHGSHGGHGSHEHGPAHAVRHLGDLLRPWRGPRRAAGPADGVVALLAAAGFEGAAEVAHADHRLGRIGFVRATRPTASAT